MHLSRVPENVTTIGLDISRSNILSSHKKAKEKGYKNFSFIIGSLTSLPFKDNIFDICVCVDVLEHILNKLQAITEVSRVCKRGAHLIGSTSTH